MRHACAAARSPSDGYDRDVSAGPYEFVFQETKWFAFGGAAHCSDCSRVLDDAVVEPGPNASSPAFDISVTYDGCVIASDAFVEACSGLPGAEFTPIDALRGFSALRVDRVVRLERFDSHARAGQTCPECGGPRYATRSGPIHLEEGETLQSGFSRTDLVFGDTADFGPEQPIRLQPVILVDEESARSIKASELSGIHFIAHPE